MPGQNGLHFADDISILNFLFICHVANTTKYNKPKRLNKMSREQSPKERFKHKLNIAQQNYLKKTVLILSRIYNI